MTIKYHPSVPNSSALFQHKLDSNKLRKHRVELHLHLDGAVRLTTLAELARAKGYKLTENNTLQEIQQLIPVHTPKDLLYFISKIGLYIPLYVGDAAAIERMAYELCEDQAKESVCYFEARYSPHFLSNTRTHFFCKNPLKDGEPGALSPRDVILAVNRGFQRGMRDFDIEARQILCMIKNVSSDLFCPEIVKLAKEFPKEIVGIDIAGDETAGYHPAEIAAFKAAKEAGIHRTVHAAESGPASNVRQAVEELFAERIGHGYNVVQDSAIYKWAQERNIHFECCPHSSVLTGSISLHSTCKHPIVRFAEDRVNFSINKDDSTITQTTLDMEYQMLRDLGLTDVHLLQANLNAARSAFLPEEERNRLVARILAVYTNQHQVTKGGAVVGATPPSNKLPKKDINNNEVEA